MSGSTASASPSSTVSGAIGNAQAALLANPVLLDMVFILAIFGLLWAWKFMVEGLLE